MAIFVRTKRVTDPLDDRVKDFICGKDHRKTSFVSSGSEHEGDGDDDSPCLSDLVHGFLELDDDAEAGQQEDRSDCESDFFSEHNEMIGDLLSPTDSFRVLLLSHVSKAVEAFSLFRSNKTVFRRNVMAYLRECGYNAAVCKTRWERSGGLPAGSYEFVDVIRSDHQRYFVDVDFAAEFEIARPTTQYERLLQALPRVFVGRSDELKQIVRLICDAAKISLKSRELHLPPWRKNRYMQTKWFGPYRRTTNQLPASMSPSPPSTECRTVGFKFSAVSDCNGRFFLPAATRTR